MRAQEGSQPVKALDPVAEAALIRLGWFETRADQQWGSKHCPAWALCPDALPACLLLWCSGLAAHTGSPSGRTDAGLKLTCDGDTLNVDGICGCNDRAEGWLWVAGRYHVGLL